MLPHEIRTRNPSKQATSGPRLRPRGHWDHQQNTVTDILSSINNQTSIQCYPHFTCCSLCNISSYTPLSLGSWSEAICCKFLVTFFQLFVLAFQTIDLTEFCMLFLEYVWNAWANFRTSPPHHRTEKTVHIDMSANTGFDLSILDIYLWGHSITVVCSAPIENWRTDTSATHFNAFQTIRNRLGTL
jgi:hypothetical protein